VAVHSPEKADNAARKSFAVEEADVSDLGSIQTLAEGVSQKYPSLNVAMNTAGLTFYEA
jgi:short-subunit dehydrogenase involved in D-alanine esterification of teichoic acids